MQQVILTLALVFTTILFGQSESEAKFTEGTTLTVSVVNALNDNGTVAFALFSESSFMKEPLFSNLATIENGVSTVTFENVEPGEYAMICFHDENENGRMDFEENGMPKENYGVSNNVMNFGPPEFESSKFEIKNEPITLEIKF